MSFRVALCACERLDSGAIHGVDATRAGKYVKATIGADDARDLAVERRGDMQRVAHVTSRDPLEQVKRALEITRLDRVDGQPERHRLAAPSDGVREAQPPGADMRHLLEDLHAGLAFKPPVDGHREDAPARIALDLRRPDRIEEDVGVQKDAAHRGSPRRVVAVVHPENLLLQSIG